MNGVCAPEEGVGLFEMVVSAYFLVHDRESGGREQLGKRLYVEVHTELEGEWLVGTKRRRRRRRRARRPTDLLLYMGTILESEA
jgi:hypothetical protein